jgi:biopolymer transport protein ExbD
MLLGVLLLSGCQREAAPAVAQKAPGADAKSMKVKVTSKGEISADGQPVTPEELDARFAALKKEQGQVWYYRDNPTGAPPDNAMTVIKLVANHKLPIQMFADPEFTKPARLR